MALRRISTDDVHNLTSGQVITDLSNIVKELLENSLDANASTISIVFHRFGLEGVEVSDDGDGIKNEDFENLCLKNYTSKLEDFSSLIDVKTLGFRGEALNSMCNISSLKVITATQGSAPKGYELCFNNKGTLVNKKIVNHKKGTLIALTDLFKNLPVRRTNLEKNYRKEYQKCLALLYSYLIISTEKRIIVYNTDLSGKKKLVLKTNGNRLVDDNIVNIFGSTGLEGLHQIQEVIELDEKYKISISGLLSGSSIGEGRLTKDRQYIFINKRPVEYKRILKLVNEAYKKTNYLQSPVIILNFEIEGNLIDINVTPDKRTILLSSKYENLLINNLESVLEMFWDHQGTYTFPIDKSCQNKISERNNFMNQTKLENFDVLHSLKDDDTNEDLDLEPVERSSIRSSKVVMPYIENEYDYNVTIPDTNENLDFDSAMENDSNIVLPVGLDIDVNEQSEDGNINLKKNESSSSLSDGEAAKELKNIKIQEQKNSKEIIKTTSSNIINDGSQNDTLPVVNQCACHSSDENEKDGKSEKSDSLFVDSDLIFLNEEQNSVSDKILEDGQNSIVLFNQKVRFLNDEIFKPSKRVCLASKDNRKFSIKGSDFTNREESEKILGLSIHKEDFKKMHIIGQFNKGFIIVHKSNTNDVLIVDQHASDEKFNFEKLNDETVFENQPLVVPQVLDINSIERLTITNNLDVFEKNGFKFKTVESEEQEQLLLTTLPYSKNTVFDMKDLNELIQLVHGYDSSSNRVPRPSKVRSMFAMRACRSSIMIGDSLNRSKMENVVQNLSGLDKPWNCPHGRPTMRHLVKIDQWKSFTDDYNV